MCDTFIKHAEPAKPLEPAKPSEFRDYLEISSLVLNIELLQQSLSEAHEYFTAIMNRKSVRPRTERVEIRLSKPDYRVDYPNNPHAVTGLGILTPHGWQVATPQGMRMIYHGEIADVKYLDRPAISNQKPEAAP